jgi:hypothetical protein
VPRARGSAMALRLRSSGRRGPRGGFGWNCRWSSFLRSSGSLFSQKTTVQRFVELGAGPVRGGGGKKKKKGSSRGRPSLMDAGATMGGSGMEYTQGMK